MLVDEAVLITGISAEEVREQTDRILRSDLFSRSERMTRFLKFTVEQALAGRADRLKEYLIAVEVYDKPETMDPRFDPIVRVEAGRLRAKIREYYLGEGRRDPILISLRKRSYAPLFERSKGENPAPNGASSPRGAARETDVSSVAVLPFADLMRRDDLEMFCDGLTQELINALTRVDGLRVVARASSSEYKGCALDVRTIGEKLHAGAILEGSVRCVGDRLRVSVQLNSTADGYSLWSSTFDRELKTHFPLQEELGRTIADRIRQRSWESPQTAGVLQESSALTAVALG